MSSDCLLVGQTWSLSLESTSNDSACISQENDQAPKSTRRSPPPPKKRKKHASRHREQKVPSPKSPGLSWSPPLSARVFFALREERLRSSPALGLPVLQGGLVLRAAHLAGDVLQTEKRKKPAAGKKQTLLEASVAVRRSLATVSCRVVLERSSKETWNLRLVRFDTIWVRQDRAPRNNGAPLVFHFDQSFEQTTKRWFANLGQSFPTKLLPMPTTQAPASSHCWQFAGDTPPEGMIFKLCKGVTWVQLPQRKLVFVFGCVYACRDLCPATIEAVSIKTLN